MDTKIRETLDTAIARILEKLATMDAEDEKRSETLSELERLHRLRIEEVKAETDDAKAEVEAQKAANECDLADSGAKATKLSAWLTFAANLAIAAGGWVMFSLWQQKEQEFEMEGTPSSPMFRNLLSSMTPKLKR